MCSMRESAGKESDMILNYPKAYGLLPESIMIIPLQGKRGECFMLRHTHSPLCDGGGDIV